MHAFLLRLVAVSALYLLALALPDDGRTPRDVAKYLQDISCTVRVEVDPLHAAHGSGTIIQRWFGSTYVLTCAHVVVYGREEVEYVDADGTCVTVPEFNNITIYRETFDKQGRAKGRRTWPAEVIRFSDCEEGHDLALLRLVDRSYYHPQTARFYLDETPLSVGTEIIHCGSWEGSFAPNSISRGTVSFGCRVKWGTSLTQNNMTSFPGGSGGIVALASDGRYVGMHVRGVAGPTLKFSIPMARIKTWAKKAGVEFILDPSLPEPSDEELNSQPIETECSPAERLGDPVD